MTKDLFLELKEKETYISQFKLDFFRLTYEEKMMFANYYTKVFGKELTRSQLNCSTCYRNAMKELSNAYFEYKLVHEETEPILITNELEKTVSNNEISNSITKNGRNRSNAKKARAKAKTE